MSMCMQRERRETKFRVGRSLAIWVASHLDQHSLLTAHKSAFPLPETWWWRDKETTDWNQLSGWRVRCDQEPYLDPHYKYGGERKVFLYKPYYCCLRKHKAGKGLGWIGNGRQLWSKAQWCSVCEHMKLLKDWVLRETERNANGAPGGEPYFSRSWTSQ